MYDFVATMFSGIGTRLLDGSYKGLRKLIKRNRNKATMEPPVHLVPSSKPKPLTESEAISLRFLQVFELINQGVEKLSMSDVAEKIGLKSPGELEEEIKNRKSPSFELISKFCDLLGVNRDWLVNGGGQPFWRPCPHGRPYEYLEEINKKKPLSIFFILAKKTREDENAGKMLVVLQMDNLCYKTFTRAWPITTSCGFGTCQLRSLFEMLIDIKKDRELYLKCEGRVISEEELDKLSNGEVYPGAKIKYPVYNNRWWDDFTDIGYRYNTKDNYETLYGKGFVDAQESIRLDFERWDHVGHAEKRNTTTCCAN